MIFTFEPHDFSLVKKAPLALNSLHCSRPGRGLNFSGRAAQKFKFQFKACPERMRRI